MDSKTDQLNSTKFQITLPKDNILLMYPSLGQSWLQLKHNLKNDFITHQQYVKFDCLILHKNQPEQPINYKIIKLQRLLTIMCKLSKKLSCFIKSQQILRIHSNSSSKKTVIKEQIMDEMANIKQKYFQKVQTLIDKIVKKYHTVIAILRIKSEQSRRYNLTQYVSYFLVSKKKEIQKQKSLSTSAYVEILKKQFINQIQYVNSKFKIDLALIMKDFKVISENDENLISFLTESSKFYRLQPYQFGTFSQNLDKNSVDMLYFNRINQNLFKIFIVVKNNKSTAEMIDQNDHFQSISLLFDWKLDDIQNSCISLQSLYRYLYQENISMEQSTYVQKSNQDNEKRKSFDQKLKLITRKFQRNMFLRLLGQSVQNLRHFFSVQDIAQVYEYFNIQTLQHIPKQKKQRIKINELYNENDNENENEGINSLNYFNQKIQQEQKQKVQNKIINSYASQNCVQLSLSQSRYFIQDFYRYYYSSIFCFIDCEKLWFFRNQKGQDCNINTHYLTYIKWIPLINQNNKPSKKNNQQYNFFANYVNSIVQTLIQPKKIQNLDIFLQNQTQQNQKQDKNIQHKQNIDQQNNYACQNNRKGSYFLYNDVQNILIYQNLSFQNINHCHYYLKNIKNDSRSEFQDQSWIQYLNQEKIRLYLKPKKEKTMEIPNHLIQSTELNQQMKKQQYHTSNQMINLIQMPVRGRYCKHIDFFDLWEVYPLIFPSPLCSPRQFQCPKCLIQIPFHELIYLTEIQTILQFIKIFIIESSNNNTYLTKNIQPKQLIKNPFKNEQLKQKLLSNKQKLLKNVQNNQSNYILKDLKLILNHKKQKLKVQGKYLLNKLKCEDEKNDKKQNEQQNVNFEIKFQQDLDKQIYDTLINPNKNFKSVRKLNKLLSTYGLSRSSKNKKSINERFFDMQNDGKQNFLQFDEKIQLAKVSIKNRWKIYKDLQKGTIVI